MAAGLLKQVAEDIKTFLNGRSHMAENPEVKTSTVFSNERSLQLALAQYLKESGSYDDVIMEYLIPKEIIAKKASQMPDFHWGDDNMYIDIVVRKGDEYVPIELKYVTDSFTPQAKKGQGMATNFLGQTYFPVEVLKRHSAQDIRCYDFWKDVKRIEFLKETFPRVIGGFCLIITNEKSLVKGPTEKASYRDFGLKNGSLSPRDKQWRPEVKTSDGRPGFRNKQNYPIDWRALTLSYKAYAIYNHEPGMKYVPKEPISDEKIQFHYFLLNII